MNNVSNITPVLRIIGVKIDPVILLCPLPYCVQQITVSTLIERFICSPYMSTCCGRNAAVTNKNEELPQSEWF